jgi:hypothetical protein
LAAVAHNSTSQQSYVNNSKILYVDSSVPGLVAFREIFQAVGFPHSLMQFAQSLEKAIQIIKHEPQKSIKVGPHFFKVIIVDYSCLTQYRENKDDGVKAEDK